MGIGVWIGAFMTWSDPIYYGPMIASLAVFLICVCGNSIGNILNVEGEHVNHTSRALIKGTFSAGFSLVIAIVCDLGAIMAAISVNWQVAVIVVVALILIVAYNFKLKRVPLVGNIVMALLGGLTFVTGGLAVNPIWIWELPGPLIPAVFIFLLLLVLEILKDVENIDSDSKIGITTFPQVVGARSALLIAIGLFVVLVSFTIVTVLAEWFDVAYKIIAVYIIDLPLLVLLILVWSNPSIGMLKASSVCLKLGIALVIVTMIIA